MVIIADATPDKVIHRFVSEALISRYSSLEIYKNDLVAELLDAVFCVVIRFELLKTHSLPMLVGQSNFHLTIRATCPVPVDFYAIPENQIFGSGFPIFVGALIVDDCESINYQVWYRPGKNCKLTVVYE